MKKNSHGNSSPWCMLFGLLISIKQAKMEQKDEKPLELSSKVVELPIIQIFGFDGKIIINSHHSQFETFIVQLIHLGKIPLKIHPDQEHLIFAIGNKISILNLRTNKQEFLSGHTHNISALEVSPTGRRIGKNYFNFKQTIFYIFCI